MGTGISKEERGVLARIKLLFVKDMNAYSKKIDEMTKAQLNAEIHNLPKSTKTEHGIDNQSSDDKKKILKLLYNIKQTESIKAAPKLLKGDAASYKEELSNFSTSKPTEKRSRRGSFNLTSASLTRSASFRPTRSASFRSTRSARPTRSARFGGKVGGFILRGGKKTLRKKRRKKQKNKKVTRKRFI